MKKHIIADSWLVSCVFICLGTAVGGEEAEKTDRSVTIEWTSIGIGRAESCVNGRMQDGPFRLSISAKLGVRPPLWLLNPVGSDNVQYLEMSDSSGKKLSRVSFDMGLLSSHQWENETLATAFVSGNSKSLPGKDAAWVWLKGSFRVPVVTLQESPVYELPLEDTQGIQITLKDERDGTWIEGVAVPGKEPEGHIFLKEYKVVEQQGRKMAEVVISLGLDHPMKVDSLQILNDQGGVISCESLGTNYSMFAIDFSRRVEKKVRFEHQSNMEKIGIRFHYISREDVVPVPVDVKWGMAGEIQHVK